MTRLTPAGATFATGYGHCDMVIGSDHPDEPVTTAFADFLVRHVTPSAVSVIGEPA
ncbi:hypothetical protein [Nocardia nepalensis]|uniref:hypothetical protein n=1 Tax=Nocardia nepalensis TaxID=3375448 RepID=UPI003B67B0AF